MNLKFNLKSKVTVIAGLTLLFITGFLVSQKALDYFKRPTAIAVEQPVAPSPQLSIEEIYPYDIPKNKTLFSILTEQDVPGPEIQKIVEAARPYYNLARIRPGIRYNLEFDESTNPQLNSIGFRFSPLESLHVKRVDNGWSAEKKTEVVELKTVHFFGAVKTSLWESAKLANMDPLLISELSEIFAWQVDFAREVKIGDRWRLSAEQKFVRGQAVGWGSILSAEYQNAGESFVAVLFRSEGEDRGYFAPDGSSLKRMFLKSPISFGRITSGFSKKRFHPILHVNRPHLGVDYGAPRGTPVKAVGDGTISFKGYSGGGGNVIKIRHNSMYETAYKHLHGFAKNIRYGVKVKQGQVIGYVGSTGLSTAPHLHFEFFQAGRFVDPVGKKFPSAEPVPQNLMADFLNQARDNVGRLPTWESIEINLRQMASDEQGLSKVQESL